jgi:alpha-D-ribose 1-methylphosphonate 5-triphosphate synthase subunit PhnI
MYVAVKGGEKAIDNAHAWLAELRRGDTALAELSVEQIVQQLRLAVDRVMTEGSLYDPELAALAIKQARGDLIEAIFLLRAYRTTLPRFAASRPVETGRMALKRRVSATFKDLPGGQVLGPTFDYTHRLLDFALAAEGETPDPAPEAEPDGGGPVPRVTDLLGQEELIEQAADLNQGGEDGDTEAEVADITRESLSLPAGRDLRLQMLARGDEGFLLALAYSTQRGYGNTHPFAAEIRNGQVGVSIAPEELGFEVEIGELEVTECQMVNQFLGSDETPPQFTRGYGLAFGQSERKAMSMALVDRALRAGELGEESDAPANDAEFVLYHCDNVQATGFTEHLKLPHYVDFQSELGMLRRLRAEFFARQEKAAEDAGDDGKEAAE